MKLDKKTLIIGALVLIGGLWFFTGKADAQEVEQSWSIDAEVGNYEKRIDGGVYTADDANYLKASTELGVIGGLGLTADVEYVIPMRINYIPQLELYWILHSVTYLLVFYSVISKMAEAHKNLLVLMTLLFHS